ncbi:phage terminase large subunit (GpA), partial [Megasphaera sp. BL7]|uniref:terminase gpA endonuclease subunit n=1 Tax=Megasphaera sp. BL7 TaxID=1285585 RepID=UPI000357988E
KASGTPIPLVILGVDDGKQQVMNRLAIKATGPQYMHFPLNENSDGLDNRGYDELYFKGLILNIRRKSKKTELSVRYGRRQQVSETNL